MTLKQPLEWAAEGEEIVAPQHRSDLEVIAMVEQLMAVVKDQDGRLKRIERALFPPPGISFQ